MKNILLAAAAIGGFVWFLKSCGPSRAADVAFTGQWKRAETSDISGTSVEEVATVKAAKGKFRIEKTVKSQGLSGAPSESDVVLVYDGKEMHERTTYRAAPGGVAEGAYEPETRSWTPGEAELREARFWARSFTGNAGAGGAVAGRETNLYQLKARRPDAEETVQAWVDAKTGIVLRSNISLFAKQVDTLLSKTSEECLSVAYGAVPDEAFAKP